MVCTITVLGKSTNYHQKIILTPSDSQLRIDYASCVSCPAGTNGGLCQHIFSLLFMFESILQNQQKRELVCLAHNHAHQKKAWGPRKRDVTPKTVMSTIVEYAKDSLERKKVAVTCTLYEARSDETRNITAAEIVSFKNLLDGDSRLSSILPEDSVEIDFLMDQYQKEAYYPIICQKNHYCKRDQ